MNMKRCFFIVLVLLGAIISLKSQIYTPGGTIQGSSGNDYVGIGTLAPTNLLHLHGNHYNSNILLHSVGGGTSTTQADLMVWASEPGVTYTGVGIANNIRNSPDAPYFVRINNNRGGSYIRLQENIIYFNLVNNNGTDNRVLTLEGNGHVGIGTSSPQTPLSVIANNWVDQGESPVISAQYGNTNLGGMYIKAENVNGYTGLEFKTLFGGGDELATRMYITHSGNVGIGTTSPEYKLTVAGDGLVYRLKFAGEGYDSGQPQTYYGIYVPSGTWAPPYQNLSIRWHTGLDYDAYSGYGGHSFYTGYDPEGGLTGLVFQLTDKAYFNCNVGVGTTDPGIYKLNVSGKIRADEVVVNTDGADIVFHVGYKLPPLFDVESFIKENNHLPGIASAAEMLKNGMNVSEMQTKLLQKIEELTLYIIELNDKIKKLESRNYK